MSAPICIFLFLWQICLSCGGKSSKDAGINPENSSCAQLFGPGCPGGGRRREGLARRRRGGGFPLPESPALEGSIVLRRTLVSQGLLHVDGSFFRREDEEAVSSVCNDIANHVTNTHKNEIVKLVLGVGETHEETVLDKIGTETAEWAAEQFVERRRRFEARPDVYLRNNTITRRLELETWKQAYGFLIAGLLNLKNDKSGIGQQAALAAFGDPAEQWDGCIDAMERLNEDLTTPGKSITGLTYHFDEQMVSISSSWGQKLGILAVLQSVTVAIAAGTSSSVYKLFDTCGRASGAYHLMGACPA